MADKTEIQQQLRQNARAREQAKVLDEGLRLLEVLRAQGVKPHTYSLERPFARRTWIRRLDRVGG